MPGRNFQECCSEGVAVAADRRQINRIFGFDKLRVDGGSGRDDTDYLAFDELCALNAGVSVCSQMATR